MFINIDRNDRVTVDVLPHSQVLDNFIEGSSECGSIHGSLMAFMSDHALVTVDEDVAA
jgi:hypothetical protein